MRLLPLVAVLLVAAAPAAAQTLTVTPEQPVVGATATVIADAPLDSLFVTYRPNSAIPVTDTLRVGGFEAMRVPFREAGVVRVSTPEGASADVSVRFAETPMSGVLVLILAGLILFGGAGFAMAKLFSGPRAVSADDVEHWPDT